MPVAHALSAPQTPRSKPWTARQLRVLEQINGAGERAAARWPGMSYWTHNWRKGGGAERMVEISKREEFYAQQYCGCVFSLRDTNKWRLANGRPKVVIGQDYYRKEAPAPEICREEPA